MIVGTKVSFSRVWLILTYFEISIPKMAVDKPKFVILLGSNDDDDDDETS